MPRRLAVLAGSGDLVDHVVAAALRAGDKVQLLTFAERATIPGAKNVRGDINNPLGIVWSVRTFRATHLVMAGGIHLSDRQREGLEKLATGDEGGNGQAKGDAALSGLGSAVKKLTGAKLIGVHDIAPELLAASGLMAGPEPSADALASARIAISAARAIGRLDLGQAVVVSGARVIAAEDIAGTDDLLARVAAHRSSGLVGDGDSVLVLGKASKPQQPADIDLPAIGPATVRGALAAGILLIVVEAKRTLLIERAQLLADAEAAGISIYGVDADA